MSGGVSHSRHAVLAVATVVVVSVLGFGATPVAAQGDVRGIAFTDPGSGNTQVELAFSDDLDPASTDSNDFTVKTTDGATVSVSSLADDDSDARLVLNVGSSPRPIEIRSVTINANAVKYASGSDVAGQTVNVTRTSTTVEESGNNRAAFRGEKVAILGNDLGEQIEVHTEKGEFIVSRSAAANSQIYVFDTKLRDLSTYRIIFDGASEFSTGRDVELTLRNLGLTVTAKKTKLTTADKHIEADISANAGKRLLKAELISTARNRVVASKTLTLGGDGQGTVRFDNPGAGTYIIRVIDVATGISKSTNDVPSRDVGGSSSFGKSVYSTTRGGAVDIVVFMKDTKTATVRIGSEDIGYQSEFTVTDNNGDGWVQVRVNTYNEGRDRSNTGGSADITTISPSGTATSKRDTISNYQLLTPSSGALKRPLAADAYDLSLSVGGEETDVATLILREQSRNSLTVRAAPRGATVNSLSSIRANAVSRNWIAIGDKVVLEIEASGLGGFLTSGYNLAKGSADAKQYGAYLEVVQRNPGPNRDPIRLDVAKTSRYVDSTNDRLYVVIDTRSSAFSQLAAGQIYDASFVLDENSPFVDADPDTAGVDREVVTSSFRLDERSATVTTVDGTNRVAVEPVRAARIAGTTTLTPGSVVTVRARSTGGSPFLYSTPVTVDEAGLWETPMDFSQVPVGTEFTLTVTDGSTTLVSKEGRVVEAAGPPRSAFGVASFEGPTSATVDDRISAAATVRNTGNAVGSVTVEYRIGNRVVGSRTVSLAAGESRDVEFDGTVPNLQAGAYTHGVFVAGTDDGQSGNISIEAGSPRFGVGDLQGPVAARAGDAITVQATVTNTGPGSGSTEVQFRFDGSVLGRQTVTVAPGETTLVRFDVTVPDTAPGNHRFGVFIGSTSQGQTSSLTIEPVATPTPRVITRTVIKTPVPATEAPGLPGFGVLVAVVAVLAAAVLGWRRGRP